MDFFSFLLFFRSCINVQSKVGSCRSRKQLNEARVGIRTVLLPWKSEQVGLILANSEGG